MQQIKKIISSPNINFEKNENLLKHGQGESKKPENIKIDHKIDKENSTNENNSFKVKFEVTKTEKNILDAVASTGATLIVGEAKISSGVLKLFETIGDGYVWFQNLKISVYYYGVAQLVGLVSKEKKDELLDFRKKVTDSNKDYIKEDQTGNIQKSFFENTNIGKSINDSSYLKYNSKLANKIQDTSEKTALVAAETVVTIFTGGVGGAAIGGLYQSGKAAEETYKKGNNTNIFQEGAIFVQGGFGALSGYANGKLGASFTTETFKSISANGFAETGSQLVKSVCNKEFVKKWLTIAIKDPMNYVSTLLMSANDIGEFVVGKKELNATNIKNLGITMVKNFGLNVLEDGFRSALGGFKAPETIEKIDTPEEIEIIMKENNCDIETAMNMNNYKCDLKTATIMKTYSLEGNLPLAQAIAEISNREDIPEDVKYVFENIDKIPEVYKFEIKVGKRSFSSSADGEFLINIDKDTIKNGVGPSSCAFGHEFGHFMLQSVFRIESISMESVPSNQKKAVANAKEYLESRPDLIIDLLKVADREEDEAWTIAEEWFKKIEYDEAVKAKECVESVFKNHDIKLIEEVITIERFKKILADSDYEEAAIEEIFKDQKLLEFYVTLTNKLSKISKKTDGLCKDYSRFADSQRISQMLNSITRTTDIISTGEKVRYTYCHENEYWGKFFDQDGISFHELFADFTSLKIHGRTEALKTFKIFAGEELYNELEKTFNEGYKKLRKILEMKK